MPMSRSSRLGTAIPVLLLLLCLCTGTVRSQYTWGSNVVQNPSFENNDGASFANDWNYFVSGSAVAQSYTLNSSVHFVGSWSMEITGGGPGVTKAAQQLVTVSNSAAAFMFSGTSKAVSVVPAASAAYAILAELQYQDGTGEFGLMASFTTGTHDFETSTRVICPAKRVTQVWLYVFTRNIGSGTMYFDNISLQFATSQGTVAANSLVAFPSGQTFTAGAGGSFTISPRNSSNLASPCGGDPFQATLSGPTTPSVSVVDIPTAMYQGTFNATVAGTYTLAVTLNSAAVASSPYTITITAAPLFPPACAVLGARTFAVAVGTTLTMQPQDAYGNTINNPLLAVLASAVPAGLSFTVIYNGAPGSFSIVANGTAAGTYSATVTAGGVPVAGGAFPITVLPGGPAPSKFTLQNSAALVTAPGIATTLSFQGRDEYNNALTATLTSLNVTLNATLSNCPNATLSAPNDVGSGGFSLTVQSSSVAQCSLSVLANGVHIAGSPFALLVTTPGFSAAYSSTSGATTEAVASEVTPARIVVVLRDAFQNPFLVSTQNFSVTSTGPSTVTAAVLDAGFGNGTYYVQYFASAAGAYVLAIRVNGQAVPGSPFSITMYTPAPTITSLVAADPADMILGYSVGDTISVVFDRATNRPSIVAATDVQAVFNFSQSLGSVLSGAWSASASGGDVAVITVRDTTGATPPAIGQLTVTVVGNLRDAAETSKVSRSVSPPLTGNFGLIGCWPYGVWFNGICWYVWLIIFIIIAVTVLSCIIFWLCWWRRLRTHLTWMDELESAELELTARAADDDEPPAVGYMGMGLTRLASVSSPRRSARMSGSYAAVPSPISPQSNPMMNYGTPPPPPTYNPLPMAPPPSRPIDEDVDEDRSARPARRLKVAAGSTTMLVPPELSNRRRSSIMDLLRKAAGLKEPTAPERSGGLKKQGSASSVASAAPLGDKGMRRVNSGGSVAAPAAGATSAAPATPAPAAAEPATGVLIITPPDGSSGQVASRLPPAPPGRPRAASGAGLLGGGERERSNSIRFDVYNIAGTAAGAADRAGAITPNSMMRERSGGALTPNSMVRGRGMSAAMESLMYDPDRARQGSSASFEESDSDLFADPMRASEDFLFDSTRELSEAPHFSADVSMPVASRPPPAPAPALRLAPPKLEFSATDTEDD